jgi:uncharacterized membrane protein YkgB
MKTAMARSELQHVLLEFLLRVLGRLAIFFFVVCFVWIAYVWFYAYHADTLGWIYASLRPLTIWLYGLIDNQLPDTLKYKVSAGLSDELGPRALFLLILGGIGELLAMTAWHSINGIVRLSRTGRIS